jgi:hypothetical protein
MGPAQLQRLLAACAIVGLTGCGGGESGGNILVPPVGPPTAAGCVRGTETLTVVLGNAQSAPPGASLSAPPTARLACESHASRGTMMPLVGANVVWNASGQGLVDGVPSTTKQTDADGLTSVGWKLAPGFASQSITASHAVRPQDVSVVFTVSVTATTTTATTCQDAGGTDHGAVTVTAVDEAWTAAGSPHHGGTIRLDNNARLFIEAGAVICLSEIAGRVEAYGSEQAPIRFFGTSMPASPSLRHVRAENAMKVGSIGSPAIMIVDSTFRWTTARDPLACAQVVVAGFGGPQRTLVSGYGSQDCAALHVRSYDYYGYPGIVEARVVDSVSDGILIDSSSDSVSFANCEVSSSGRHGIVVPLMSGGNSATVSAMACNLFGNVGDAINNQSSLTVSAGGNWWGDPAGPAGAAGDGVFGNVDAGNPSATPLGLGY